jgi:hypothetical protein
MDKRKKYVPPEWEEGAICPINRLELLSNHVANAEYTMFSNMLDKRLFPHVETTTSRVVLALTDKLHTKLMP